LGGLSTEGLLPMMLGVLTSINALSEWNYNHHPGDGTGITGFMTLRKSTDMLVEFL